MFENIGNKIKSLAKILCWLGIISSIFITLIMFFISANSYEELYIIYGILFLIIGPLSSWINSFFIYGFGELIENSQTIIEILEKNNTILSNKLSKPIQTANTIDRYDNSIRNDIIKKMIKNTNETDKNNNKANSPQIENTEEIKNSIIVSDVFNEGKCSRCGNILDVYASEIVRPFGKSHQKLCKVCLKKYEQEKYDIIEKNQ
ncbi:MAG: hypothetical protein IKT38_00910 [Clostridia bacterium]|nr:hypothetical protein [Clostridia bacterium]